jgi:hypothetical protein
VDSPQEFHRFDATRGYDDDARGSLDDEKDTLLDESRGSVFDAAETGDGGGDIAANERFRTADEVGGAAGSGLAPGRVAAPRVLVRRKTSVSRRRGAAVDASHGLLSVE